MNKDQKHFLGGVIAGSCSVISVVGLVINIKGFIKMFKALK